MPISSANNCCFKTTHWKNFTKTHLQIQIIRPKNLIAVLLQRVYHLQQSQVTTRYQFYVWTGSIKLRDQSHILLLLSTRIFFGGAACAFEELDSIWNGKQRGGQFKEILHESNEKLPGTHLIELFSHHSYGCIHWVGWEVILTIKHKCARHVSEKGIREVIVLSTCKLL